MRSHRNLALALSTFALLACGGDSATAPSDGLPSSFAVTLSGDIDRSLTGFARTFYFKDGYRLTHPFTQSSDVTEILLVPDGVEGPQVNLGLLGEARVGRYTVHVGGTRLGERLELIAKNLVRRPDGGRDHYHASSGVLEITAVSPRIEGTFSFRATQVARWPAEVVVGTTVRSEPAELSFSGTFRAPRP